LRTTPNGGKNEEDTGGSEVPHSWFLALISGGEGRKTSEKKQAQKHFKPNPGKGGYKQLGNEKNKKAEDKGKETRDHFYETGGTRKNREEEGDKTYKKEKKPTKIKRGKKKKSKNPIFLLPGCT